VHVRRYVNCVLFSSDFNQNYIKIFSTNVFSKNVHETILRRHFHWEPSCYMRTDGHRQTGVQTDKQQRDLTKKNSHFSHFWKRLKPLHQPRHVLTQHSLNMKLFLQPQLLSRNKKNSICLDHEDCFFGLNSHLRENKACPMHQNEWRPDTKTHLGLHLQSQLLLSDFDQSSKLSINVFKNSN